MIIYLASYPRSGNSWLQSFLGNQFRRLPTVIHGTPQNVERYKQWVYWADKVYQFKIQPAAEGDLPPGFPLSNDRYVIYRPAKFPEDRHFTLVPGFEAVLTDEVRESLAEDSEHFVVKTHYYPHAEYYPGEIVIHIVRNPGACLYSLFRFFVDVRKFNISFEKVIYGSHGWGSWSDYQNQWLDIAKTLGDRMLWLKYEQVFDNELGICEQISRTIDLPIRNNDIKPFEYYHRLRPNITREGKRVGWEVNYSQDQLKLLLKQHGDLMEKLGYASSDIFPK